MPGQKLRGRAAYVTAFLWRAETGIPPGFHRPKLTPRRPPIPQGSPPTETRTFNVDERAAAAFAFSANICS